MTGPCKRGLPALFVSLFFMLIVFSALSCAGSPRPSPQEYYELAQAYQKLDDREAAKKWYRFALDAPETDAAARYQLGVIAWEEKDYETALALFTGLLEADPDNSMVLRSAAWAALYAGDIELADRLYSRLLEIVPDSREEEYNHILVLSIMERFEEADAKLSVWLDGKDAEGESVLLLARIKRGLNDPIAIDHYAAWIEKNSNQARVRREYADLLHEKEFYAKAVEQYNELLKIKELDAYGWTAGELHFAKARILADAEDEGAAASLDEAIRSGYEDEEAILALNERLGRDINAIEAAKKKTESNTPAAKPPKDAPVPDVPAADTEPEADTK